MEGAVAAAAVAAPAPSAVARRFSGGTMCGGLETIVRPLVLVDEEARLPLAVHKRIGGSAVADMLSC